MSYEFTMMRKVRSKLIACFSKGEFSIPNDYTISSAEGNKRTFEVKTASRNGVLSGLQELLLKDFSEKIRCKITGNILTIDVHTLYEDVCTDNPKPENENGDSGKKEMQDVEIKIAEKEPLPEKTTFSEIKTGTNLLGEKVMKYLCEGFLSDGIIRAMDIEFFDEANGDFRIRTKKESISILWTIVRSLEEHPGFAMSLRYENNSVVVCKNKISTAIVERMNMLNKFLTVLGSFTKKHKVSFSFSTPFTVATSTDPMKLCLVAESRAVGIVLFNLCTSVGPNWYPVLRDDTITITLSAKQMEETIKRGISGPEPVHVPLGDIREETPEKTTVKKPEKPILRKSETEPLVRSTDKKEQGVKPDMKTELAKIESTLTHVSSVIEEIKGKGLQKSQLGTDRKNMPVYGYVHESSNYDEFEFLDFNRKTKKKHVNKLKASILKHDVVGFVRIVITDIIDGTMRKYIVDGQHTFKALKELGLPILYIICKGVNSKEELVELIADLNCTSKSWTLEDYLFAWESVHKEVYGTIRETMIRTKLPLITTLEALSGLSRSSAQDRFKSGKFLFEDKSLAETYLNYIVSLKSFMSRSRNLFSGCLSFFRRMTNYNHEQMVKNMSALSEPLRVDMTESQDAIVAKLVRIYNPAA